MTPRDKAEDKTPDSVPTLSADSAIMFCLLAVAHADGPVGACELDLIVRLVETCHTSGEAQGKTGAAASLELARELLSAEDGLAKRAGAGMRSTGFGAVRTSLCARSRLRDAECSDCA